MFLTQSLAAGVLSWRVEISWSPGVLAIFAIERNAFIPRVANRRSSSIDSTFTPVTLPRVHIVSRHVFQHPIHSLRLPVSLRVIGCQPTVVCSHCFCKQQYFVFLLKLLDVMSVLGLALPAGVVAPLLGILPSHDHNR